MPAYLGEMSCAVAQDRFCCSCCQAHAATGTLRAPVTQWSVLRHHAGHCSSVLQVDAIHAVQAMLTEPRHAGALLRPGMTHSCSSTERRPPHRLTRWFEAEPAASKLSTIRQTVNTMSAWMAVPVCMKELMCIKSGEIRRVNQKKGCRTRAVHATKAATSRPRHS